MLVLVYAPPAVHAAELAAVCDVLAWANSGAAGPPYYDVRIVADDAAPLQALSGFRVLPDVAIADAHDPAGLLVVMAGGAWPEAPPTVAAVEWLRRQAAGAARYGAIGNGAFALGAAGLLDGRRVTTHWECSDELIRAFPAALIDRDRIFVRDGALFSSSGGGGATDVMLHLIEEDHGRELALEIARRLVLFMKRSGAQAQLSVSLATQLTTRDPIQRVQNYIRDYPCADLTVTTLAAIAAMSPRNFARVFQQQTGMRPTDFVEQTRVNLAKRMLEESALPSQQVARLCGFSGSEAARRAFKRRAGATMPRYRARLTMAEKG